MSISTRFAVGIHILSLLEINKEGVNTSEYIAGSVNTNPALIRKITGMLKHAGLVNVRPGVAGAALAKDLSDITLLDVYRAVDIQDKELFGIHDNTNLDCPVGRNIQSAITPFFSIAETALEKALGVITLEDVVKDIKMKEQQNIKTSNTD
ncbi:Rrf2 family transcriptional regulator [Heyndrickxia acidicola]|uniref:Rrf2 family transcriptional regulator n=1 Tax=Heyndrickxia acidicola TaxID=209389 RepID=A0ABU6MM84_9BACI|nr:Rrf2 family transcriptional regulator [Heyndrickxia acidicola]MED1205786.1 Rrf2 family transcriptional regulator [Heyndrickxia acidicola]